VEFLRFVSTGTLDGQKFIDVQMRGMQDFKTDMARGIIGPSPISTQDLTKGFVEQLGETKKDGRGCITLIRRERQRTTQEQEL